MKTKISLGIILILLIGVIGVLAQPPNFHEFYGNVYCENNDEVNENTLINVTVNSSGTIKSYETLVNENHFYHIIVEGFDDDEIQFYIENELLDNTTFESFNSTELDLTTQDNDLCYVDDGGGSPLIMKNGGSPVIMKNGGTHSECDDGIDNDGDGLIDYPLDPGCDDSDDDNETDPYIPPSPGCDNDCSAGSLECLTDTNYKRCGHYDEDFCSEWSDSISCEEGYICEEGECTPEEGTPTPEKRMDITPLYITIAGIIIVAGVFFFISRKVKSKKK